MSFTLAPYNKPYQDTAALLVKLQGQGLGITDHSKAQSFLDCVNYYRFRGYLYSYFDLPRGKPWFFYHGSEIAQPIELYDFDQELRHFLFGCISKVEVLIRSKLDATMSAHSGDGFWYLKNSYFNKDRLPEAVLHRLHGEFSRSKEEFALHYHKSYYNQISSEMKGLPPFWVLSELCTLGQILEVLRALKPDASGFNHTSRVPVSTPLDKMAQGVGAASYKQLLSWMTVLRAVRNLCAHHSRLWNRNLPAPDGINSHISITPVATGSRKPVNTLYAAIICIRVICKKNGIDDSISDSLSKLFLRFPQADRYKQAMGVPQNWDSCRVWQ